ncbi:hypothetical protein UFOVP1008_49 [uncultured Caudovirales phage]|uniref:Uncharacterized protein n=1 Tax=uncultured Caudovirales phage TaxID=2100421 RepID=A0A6J5MMY7_9CAUD|nr:hypothetical protein UFOVP498_4 [uncultured Caudovirales phage]CAB4177777.1 hypothetical protein UFOVP1008_49 [uncultured Caudovirales phage]CAB4187547.1 hypothetical protein UFOVP1160_50 [uncultured Caudovirales phage]CAB4200515.1 hypothetical protein UFOVP1352_53 [uncultured Caudovirales phage]
MTTEDAAQKKAIRKSKTLWMAAATAAAGAILTASPEAIPHAASGPGLLLIAALQAILRVYTTQSIK